MGVKTTVATFLSLFLELILNIEIIFIKCLKSLNNRHLICQAPGYDVQQRRIPAFEVGALG